MQEYSQLQTKFNSLLSDKEKLETNLQNQLEIISQRQSQEEEELNRLLNEERQRCDALANDMSRCFVFWKKHEVKLKMN